MKLVYRIIVLLLIPIGCFSQASFLQRLAFAPVNLSIEAKGISRSIESFCFDGLRGSPGNLNTYKFVQFDGGSELVIGNATAITLQEAITKGYLELVGEGYGSFSFKNNTSENVFLKTKHGSLLGDVPNDTRGATKEALELSKHDGQDPLWDSRKLAESEERKIMIYQLEKLLPSNNPTKAQLEAAD